MPDQSALDAAWDLVKGWDAETREALRVAASVSGLQGEAGGVRLHDLRHSFASVGVAHGEGLPLIGALLGHRHAATTHRYSHLSDDPVRAASERIGEHIAAAMGPTTDGGTVVTIDQARRQRPRRDDTPS